MILVLLRHGESVWNRENLFTGWTDVELSESGRREAENAGRLLRAGGYDFDVCYTSYLKRAIHTLNGVLSEMDREWLPVIKAWELNERHYGALQGLNKAETAEKYGEAQVKTWRRSFDVPPPLLAEEDQRNPRKQEQYRGIDAERLPLAESLKDTIARAVPYYENHILPDLEAGKRVLIVAHGNSLRGLMMYFDKLSREEISEVNIPTGVPLVYKFDSERREHIYLGNQQEISAKMQNVADQGKA